jgi:hypothetical protein
MDAIIFKSAVRKHKPNGYIRFMYRWFNTNTFQKPYPIGSWALIFLFLFGTTGMIINDQKGNRKKAQGFAWIIVTFFLFLFTLPAYWMNQARIKKICKELGITIEVYSVWIKRFPV